MNTRPPTPVLADPGTARASNLAIALLWLPRARREDALVYFRFCRAVDDLADDPGLPAAAKIGALSAWKSALAGGTGLPAELARVLDAHRIPPAWPLALVDGCLRDADPRPFATLPDLLGYCWQVAPAVGLACTRIFGCASPESAAYAENLGYALQLTNIARDVRADAEIGRAYIPLDILAALRIPSPLDPSAPPPPRLPEAIRRITAEARRFFSLAVPPPADRLALRPAIAMQNLYTRLLDKIEARNCDTWTARPRLTAFEKFLGLLSAFAGPGRRGG